MIRLWYPFQLLCFAVRPEFEYVHVAQTGSLVGPRPGRLPLLVRVQSKTQNDHRTPRHQFNDAAQRLLGGCHAVPLLGGAPRCSSTFPMWHHDVVLVALYLLLHQSFVTLYWWRAEFDCY